MHSLDLTSKRREEISFIFARLIFETSVNIRFLIANFSKKLINTYVKSALRHERKLRDVIEANIGAGAA